MADLKDSKTPVAGSFSVVGAKVVVLGNGERKFIHHPQKGRIYIPKELGFNEGDMLSGTITLNEATYVNEPDGKTQRATPLVRLELNGFISDEDELKQLDKDLQKAIIKAKTAAVAKVTWDASAFGFTAPAKATAESIAP